MNIEIVSATTQDNWEDTALYQSLCDLELNGDIPIQFITNNKKGLAEVYNERLDRYQDLDAIIFVHDDVYLQHDPRPQLKKLFEEFDIVGVAGCSRAEIKSPALWHLMGGQGNLHGAVAHKHNNKKYMTSFGPYPQRVMMIDGVFMAFNKKAIRDARFDEDCPSKFHFYDCILSLDACLQKMKIGVGDISITHESPGLRGYTDDWLEGQEYFLNKYKKYQNVILSI